MSSSSFRRSSISKQRGAEMSSRLMPPKPGAIACTVATISSGSLVSRQIGKASTPANSLKSIALPSITGIAAARADVAEAEHRGAVGDDGDRVALDRVLEGLVGVVGDRRADARDAGRVGHREVVARLQRRACCAARSCRRRASGTCGRCVEDAARPSTASIASMICVPVLGVGASTVMSRTSAARRPRRGRPRRSCRRPRRSRSATSPEHAGPVLDLDADREAVLRGRRDGHGPGQSTCRTVAGRHHAKLDAGAIAVGGAPTCASVSAPRARRALPDRRQLPRLPRVLRAARVDRDLDGLADERDLRLRLDAREDPHRVRPEADDRRLGRRHVRAARRSTPTTRRSARRGPTCSSEQWPHLEPLVEAFGYRNVSVEGYEADDVIATLAERARKAAASR